MEKKNSHYCASCNPPWDHDTTECPTLKPVRDEIAAAIETLLPCPFCGSKATITEADFNGVPMEGVSSGRDRFSTGCWVECTGSSCGLRIGYSEAYDDCEGGAFETGKDASESWNRRA